MYSPLGKALEKQAKITERQEEKQVKANEKSNGLIKKYDYNAEKGYKTNRSI